MTITRRFVYHGIRTTVAFTLLLAVISSPIRPTKPFGPPTVPSYLPRHFAVIETGDDRGYVAPSRSTLTKADSLLADLKVKHEFAELEEELHATFQPSCAMFGVLPSPCSETHRELIGFAALRRPARSVVESIRPPASFASYRRDRLGILRSCCRARQPLGPSQLTGCRPTSRPRDAGGPIERRTDVADEPAVSHAGVYRNVGLCRCDSKPPATSAPSIMRLCTSINIFSQRVKSPRP